MLALFTNNLLPVFLAAAAGYMLAWRLKLDPRPVSQAAFFAFAPCLVFRIILESALPGEALLRMVGFTLTSLLVLVAVVAFAASRLGWSRPLTAAVVLVVFLPNAGVQSFMRLPYSRELEQIDIAVYGMPLDLGTSNRPGARFGPRAIREHSLLLGTFTDPFPPHKRS